MPEYDYVIVGGGIVGLSAAWQLQQRHPRSRLVVVEAAPRVAGHQTSHNSGVVHAGVYYAPGSLKADLCTRGKMMLEEFCSRRSVPLEHNGKVIVATRPDELEGLESIFERASANRVPGLRRLDARQLKEVEPSVSGVGGVHSPTTGVVDFSAVALALAEEVVERGGTIRTSWPVARVRTSGRNAEVVSERGEVVTAHAGLVCAGLQADRLASATGSDVRTMPFRGSWYEVDPTISSDIRGSIYPVPDATLPFLGVHLTRRIDGRVWAGPNAFLAFSRKDYRRVAFRPRDAAASLTFPGTWRLAAKYGPMAVQELRNDLSVRSYAREVARYVPGTRKEHLTRGPMGIRAQAMDRRGSLIDDFLIRADGNVLHVLNAPSPAATASLAIGEYLCTQLDGLVD